MATANNWKELEALLKQKIAKAMVKEGEFLKEKVQERIEEDVYKSYSPTYYERSGDLKRSVFSKTPKVKNNSIEVEVKHNTDEINSNSPNQHYSVVDGYSPSDVSDWIPYLVTQGKTHPLWGENVYTRPRDYFENTKKQLESSGEHIDKMVEYLRAEGLNAKKG